MSQRTRVLRLGAVVMTMSASMVAGSSAAAPPSAPAYVCPTVATPAAAGQTKIMIAGDSITNASAGDYTWRYWFYRDQVEGGARINLVGSFNDTIDANTLEQGQHTYLDCAFDQDEEARPGVKLYAETGVGNPASNATNFTSPTPATCTPNAACYPGAASWISGAVAKHTPDVVIVFAGANDLFRIREEEPQYTAGTATDAQNDQIAAIVVDRMHTFVKQAQAARPGVDLVIAKVQVAPGANARRYTTYNNLLAAQAPTWQTSSSRIALATIPSWSDHTWDGVHPDAVGETRIAAAMDTAVHSLVPTLAPRPRIARTPAIGPRFPAVVSASATGGNGVALTWTLPPGTDHSLVRYRVVGTSAWTTKADVKGYTSPQSYTVGGLTRGTSYEFAVALGKGMAVSPYNSAGVTAKAGGGVAAVAQLAPVAGVHTLAPRWSVVSGATAYQVRWRASGSPAYSGPVTTASTSTVLRGLVAGRRYLVSVRALEGAEAGPWTPTAQEVAGVPRANPLAAGKKPVLTAASGHRIKAVWAASAGANRYQLQRRQVGKPWTSLGLFTTRSYVGAALVKGKSYEYRVRPFDGDVGGVVSAPARRKVG